ncbi:hypothetical protein F52700_4536 [Fusarium sp. NRRL 52700]|nr:hypothetical protein F52700_4536 [Fusarium sp. NRRL 52700]
MYSNLLIQAILGLRFPGSVAATSSGCAYPCAQIPPEPHEPWLCPIGIARPHYYTGNWPTLEEENLAKALIGPVIKQQPCGWQADAKLCRAAQNTHISLSLVTSNPLTVKVKVNNHGGYPITFWTRYSPLSQYAFDYGYFKIATHGQQSVTAEAYPHPPQGYRPDYAPELSVVLPGEALEADIVLTNLNHVFHQLVKNGGDIEISMSGQWNGFWPTIASEVMHSNLGHACNNIWNSLGLTWSSSNKLLLRFPKEHHVSSTPQYSIPKYEAEPDTSVGSKPTYPSDSSLVSRDETKGASSDEQSESKTQKDGPKSEESYTSGQPTTESPEYTSLADEAGSSSTDSPAPESSAYGSLPTEPSELAFPKDTASEDSSSTSASQSAPEEAATTPGPFALLPKRTEQQLKTTSATKNWTTMASTTTERRFARSAAACKEDCQCKGPQKLSDRLSQESSGG